jgi:hypothetical protein
VIYTAYIPETTVRHRWNPSFTEASFAKPLGIFQTIQGSSGSVDVLLVEKDRVIPVQDNPMIEVPDTIEILALLKS